MTALKPFENGLRWMSKDLEDWFEEVRRRFFGDVPVKWESNIQFVPRVDIAETEKEYEIEVSVPGLKAEDFNVEITDNVLKISGERKFQTEEKEKTYHRIESFYGSFARSFTLPEDAKSDKISATYENGILKIVIPKDVKKSRSRKIEVK